MSKVPFTKYSGCGNDFILVDERIPHLPKWSPKLVQRLCERGLGIGADGVVLLEKSATCDVKMRIYNADGSEAEMCGNGLRCLAKFMVDIGFEMKPYTVETLERKLQIEPLQNAVKASMGAPQKMQWHIQLKVEEALYQAHFLDTGVPHVVIFVDELAPIPVEELGRKIRFHPHFEPKGANANFAKIVSKQAIAIRTYERGVEKETLACGTGATAAAIAAAHVYGLSPPIAVETKSCDLISIDFSIAPSKGIQNVFQTGPVAKHFSGVFDFQRNEVV